MIFPGPDQSDIGQLAGQIKEFLELQKDLGRKFILQSRNKTKALEVLPPRPATQYNSLAALYQAVSQCRKCPSLKMRSQAVPGQGPAPARLMLIGSGPGKEDEEQGYPFSGPDGQLLTKMIQAIQLSRKEIFLTQIIKCRTPDDRQPTREEMESCDFFLKEEIRLVNPGILVALGDWAAQALSGSSKSMVDLRGRWLKFRDRRLMAIFHPAFLLTNPGAKREAWEDLKKIRRVYDELAK